MLISDDELQKVLLKLGLLTEKKMADVVEFAKHADSSFQDALLEKNIISDENLGVTIANHLKIPFVNLTKTSIPSDVFHIVPERLVRSQKVLAFARDEKGIKLAMTDPTNTQIQQLISQKTSQPVTVYYATERDILNACRIFKKNTQQSFEKLLEQQIQKGITSEAPIAKIVDMLIDHAYSNQASDIHIEPQENNSLIRFRIDGVLHDVLVVPKPLHERIVTRIKVLSRLRTDEHLAPQDGKMRQKTDLENLDLRVSMLPIADGEKIVMRLLSSHSRQISLIDLGMNEADLEKIHHAFTRSFGMILSTGPTGSGKSTTIYSILKILNTREKNITTIEDPVEYRIKGVNQINVNVKTNLTFASGLRSILRQDPNIIFVGEIRDIETAGIAVNAALTGHLVLSTLHTNDAATALPRLTDMKIEPYLVASTVSAIIAQRLIRKICEMCKSSFDISQEELAKHFSPEIIKKYLGTKQNIRLYRGAGCKICNDTGYSGRLGVFEILEMTPKVRKLVLDKADADIITKQAVADGMTTMLDDGLMKVNRGLTTIEEVLRVTKVETI